MALFLISQARQRVDARRIKVSDLVLALRKWSGTSGIFHSAEHSQTIALVGLLLCLSLSIGHIESKTLHPMSCHLSLCLDFPSRRVTVNIINNKHIGKGWSDPLPLLG